MKLDFFAHAVPSRSVTINSQQLINWYPLVDETSRGKIALYPTPGLIDFAVLLSDAEGRGMVGANGMLYAVVADRFYEVDSAGTATHRGSLNTDSGRVSMADSGVELMIVDGANGYIFNYATATFSQITDPDFPGADIVVYKDTYFAFNVPDSNQWMITGSFDGGSVDALDIAASEESPDNIVGLARHRSELWIFNATSIEVDYNSGEAAFPFARINGATMEVGCVAPHSIAETEGFVAWLGQDRHGKRQIYAASGYSPQVISDQYLDRVIQSYGGIDDAYAYIYGQDGHTFYVLTFPRGPGTFAFDLQTKLWHQRSSFGIGRSRIAAHAFFNDRDYVLDYADGHIYELSPTARSEAGISVRREAMSQHLHSDGKMLRHHELEIFFQPGVGRVTVFTDPQVMLRWSDDGGNTWSNEHWRSLGRRGEYKARTVWRKLGTARDRVYHVAITDQIRAVLVDSNLRASEAQH
jgi:hypothetical protein